jgi:hypothetical protein
MFYAMHSTLNGIIPLLTVRITGLMAFAGKSFSSKPPGMKKVPYKQHFNWAFRHQDSIRYLKTQ